MSRGGVLVTRPAAQAQALASSVRDRGYQPILAPCASAVISEGPEIDLTDVAAIAVTSANGAAALAARSAERSLPLFAVGHATAATAREAGFTRVEVAAGDVTALERVIAANIAPGRGVVLHVSGEDVAGDLAGDLAALGFRTDRRVLYRMQPAAALPLEARAALAAGEACAVLLMSARTAKLFGQLTEEAGLSQTLAEVEALCLSAAVAEAASAMTYRRIAAAGAPTQDALLELLETTSCGG